MVSAADIVSGLGQKVVCMWLCVVVCVRYVLFLVDAARERETCLIQYGAFFDRICTIRTHVYKYIYVYIHIYTYIYICIRVYICRYS